MQIIVWKNLLSKKSIYISIASYLIKRQKERISQKKAFNVIDSWLEWYLSFDTLYINIIRRGWNEANNPWDHDSLSREKLNSRYRSTSSTILVKLPRGCMDTKWTRNQVVLTARGGMEIRFTLFFTVSCLEICHKRSNRKASLFMIHVSCVTKTEKYYCILVGKYHIRL